MTHSEIWTARGALDKARRDKVRELMREFDVGHHAAMKRLQAECESIGHNWRFTHLGPFGTPWFSCIVCHASRADEPVAEE